MLLVNLQKIKKEFAARTILEDVSLKITSHQKLGLIGPNGSGKTTLVKILTGEMEPSDGSVKKAKDLRIGHVRQHVEVSMDITVLAYALGQFQQISDQLLSAEKQLSEVNAGAMDSALKIYQAARDEYDRIQGDHFQNKAHIMLDALGLQGKLDQSVNSLSGGEKNVLSMARALLAEPDLLVLDEPGNHLDFSGIAWLEDFLNNFKGAVLIISHNRYLLDRVVDGLYCLENRGVRYYNGGYSAYRETRLRELLAQQSDYVANQKRLKRLEDLVLRFEQIARTYADPAWGKRLRARRSQLEREKRTAVEKPKGDHPGLKLNFRSQGSKANIALQIKHYSKAFDDRVIFDKADLEISCGERVALIGPNGSGKSTLLKDIVAHGNWDSDEIRIGPSLEVFYCAQEQEILHPEWTLMEEIRNTVPYTPNETAKFMSRFNFTWDDLQKPIKALSGGERNRVQLALMMLNKPNFLILDEPTNHLDIPAREAVEDALCDLDATILAVSHDRYFLDKIVNRVIEIDGGKLVSYSGGFSDYWFSKKQSLSKTSGRIKKRRQDREQPKSSGKSRHNEQDLERKIGEAEEEKRQLEELINTAFNNNDYREGRRITQKLNLLNTRLKDLYDQWMEADAS
jgi:ATP-binding cassette, subfamily F, member 3